jgi:hypothetical protein
MNWRNAKRNKSGTIDCEIQSPRFGWVPFTANPNDKGAAFDVAAMVAEIEAFGVIAPYVAPEPEPEPVANPFPDLSAFWFEWLLSYSGLGDVWEAVEAALRDTDRATYADVRAQRRATVYTLAGTLAMVAELRPVADGVAPEIDLSDQAIMAAWSAAIERAKE